MVGRQEGTINDNLKTGKIEIMVDKVTIINEAKTPPFMIENNAEAAEEIRLKYRYLDLTQTGNV